MSKKEAKARKAAYTNALAEGRVVRYNGGMSFRSFLTVQDAEFFLETVRLHDLSATIIQHPFVL